MMLFTSTGDYYKVYIVFKLNRSVADLAGIQTCSSTMRDFYPSLTQWTADLVIHMGDTKYFEHENFTKRKGYAAICVIS